MANPNLRDETSTYMQNYSSEVDMSELGACCLDLLQSTSTSTSEATVTHADLVIPEIDYFSEMIDRNSIGYCKELEEPINSTEQLPQDLEEMINSLKLEATSAKNTFEDKTIDFHYGTVIRDAENALNEVQSQPDTTKSNLMVGYYSKHCQFMVNIVKQEKASCIDDNYSRCDEVRLKQLQRAENLLDKLAKCFTEISNSYKK
ncbi:uncharacterized protein LOC131662748 isoform X2 [Phymastichus coffea]|uniref:uncharacterized protein LOC131662748 isoform X2 n=1 Tax=Phymastichus coffea TaxID=108790 RepID=UPI00273A8CE4|nr:uncharacterized protein LOC131662748 isoform X2 [Phymastichus coffea]